jgi:putative oxidoreductase
MSVFIVFGARCLLVLLFLPFSALDKIVNFKQAVAQAAEAVPARWAASSLIIAGLCIEIVMSLGILTGIADRAAACVMGGYCVMTAILWKQFWKTGDFRLIGPSRGRDTFWDFLKNLALAGGFLLISVGPRASSVQEFLQHPFASSHPYSVD